MSAKRAKLERKMLQGIRFGSTSFTATVRVKDGGVGRGFKLEDKRYSVNHLRCIRRLMNSAKMEIGKAIAAHQKRTKLRK